MREDSWEQETRKSYHQRRGWVVQVWRNLEGLFFFGERNAQRRLQQTKSAPSASSFWSRKPKLQSNPRARNESGGKSATSTPRKLPAACGKGTVNAKL